MHAQRKYWWILGPQFFDQGTGFGSQRAQGIRPGQRQPRNSGCRNIPLSTGRPKGSKTYAIRQLVAEALSDPTVWKDAVDRFRDTLKTRKTVISGLEFAARVNREVGLGRGETPAGGVTIIFESNIRVRKPGQGPPNVRQD